MTYNPQGVGKAARRKRIEDVVDRLVVRYLKREISANEMAETLVREAKKP